MSNKQFDYRVPNKVVYTPVKKGEQQTKFHVMDAIMGSFKSSRLIEMMAKAHYQQPFLYIAPLIDECHRIAGTTYVQGDEFKRPIIATMQEVVENGNLIDMCNTYAYDPTHPLAKKQFRMPDYRGGTKADNLLQLIESKRCIASTHQLLTTLTPEMLENACDYILIIDEALSVMESYDGITTAETRALFKKGILSVAEDGWTLVFNHHLFGNNVDSDNAKDTRYEQLAKDCDRKALACVDGSYVIWQLDINVLKSFKEVWIATYMFDNSKMASWLKFNGVEWTTDLFGKSPKEIANLINIVGVDDITSYDSMIRSRHHKLNEVGKGYYTHLSNAHLNREGKPLTDLLHKNLENFFRNICKSKSNDRLLTTFKKHNGAIAKTRYRNSWLAFNTKATNKWADRHNLAYMMNLFNQPAISRLCAMKGYPLDDNQMALSELVQWIWRSAIRKGEPINLYIPSVRMRELLICWLNEWDYYGKVGEHPLTPHTDTFDHLEGVAQENEVVEIEW